MAEESKKTQLEITQLEKYNLALPKVFDLDKANKLKALFEGISQIDLEVSKYARSVSGGQLLESAKDNDLSIHGQNLGIGKSKNMDISDEAFKELIKKISFQKKMIIRAFYDLAEIFYEKKYIYAHIILNFDDSNLMANLKEVIVDGGYLDTVEGMTKESINDLSNVEVNGVNVYVYSKIPGLTGSVTVGSSGSINTDGSSRSDANKRYTILDRPKRFCIYDYGLGDVKIEYPIDVQVIQKTRIGSGYMSSEKDFAGLPVNTELTPQNIQTGITIDSSSELGATYIFHGTKFFDQFIGIKNSNSVTIVAPVANSEPKTVVTILDIDMQIQLEGKMIINMETRYEVEYVYNKVSDTVHTVKFDLPIGINLSDVRNLAFLSARTKFNPTGIDLGTYVTSIAAGIKDIKEYFARIKAAGVKIDEITQN